MLIFPFFRSSLCMAPDAGGASGAGAASEAAADQMDEAQAQQSAQTAASAAPEATAQTAPAAEEQPVAEQKAEPEAERAREDAQKTEQADTREALRERVHAMQAKLGEYQLRTAAALAGVAKERIPYVMRMADVTGLDPSAADAAERYQQAIDRVLADVPELRGGAGVGTGSVGNFARKADAIDPELTRIERNILGM